MGIYCYEHEVNNDNLHTENKVINPSGLFHSGENDLFTTITTKKKPALRIWWLK